MDLSPEELAADVIRLRHMLEAAAAQAKELAGKVPRFTELADTLEALSSETASPLIRPPRGRRENKPPEYRELAVYSAVALGLAAFDLHKKGESLTVDRVMAEVFGETRSGAEGYANDLGRPWLPLCGRSWDQARFLVGKGFGLIGCEPRHVFAYVEAGDTPWAVLLEIAIRNAALRDEAAADAVWRSAGVKRGT
ncbi:MAG TPA: hypothetical protein VIH81_15635 [Roseiarcus sp.]